MPWRRRCSGNRGKSRGIAEREHSLFLLTDDQLKLFRSFPPSSCPTGRMKEKRSRCRW
ncbi:hypothetical protein AMELA_G00189760 [Ameiurus melas]|uniref:Uncharacterized protein n=1 Tax=Ameiurus melas TaxID=219545 RepID=A0A7J6ACG1_AMEME|nr:hypothetical protein AMELA_G00189760 [Ameiurus melas]